MERKTSQAKIDANTRYMKNHLKRVPFDVKKEYYSEVLEPEAAKRGLSVRAFLLQSIDFYIKNSKIE